MSDDKRYNGWTNYETWNVALWMGNEQGSDSYWREAAQEAYDQAEAKPGWSREEVAAVELARRLKDEHEEAKPDLGASVWGDLLGAALSEVNWREIAENMLEDVDKEEEPDDDLDDEEDEDEADEE